MKKYQKEFTSFMECVYAYSDHNLTSITSVWPNLAPPVQKCMPSSFLLSQFFLSVLWNLIKYFNIFFICLQFYLDFIYTFEY